MMRIQSLHRMRERRRKISHIILIVIERLKGEPSLANLLIQQMLKNMAGCGKYNVNGKRTKRRRPKSSISSYFSHDVNTKPYTNRKEQEMEQPKMNLGASLLSKMGWTASSGNVHDRQNGTYQDRQKHKYYSRYNDSR